MSPAKIHPIELVCQQNSLFLTDAEACDLIGATNEELSDWKQGVSPIPFSAMEKLAIFNDFNQQSAKDFEQLIEDSTDFDYSERFEIILIAYERYDDLIEYNPTYKKTLPVLNLHRALLWETYRVLTTHFWQYTVRMVSFNRESYQQWLSKNNEEDELTIFPWDEARYRWAQEQVLRQNKT